MALEQSGLQFFEQMFHRQQGGSLRRVEPKAGELDALDRTPVTAEAVTVGIAIVDDGRFHAAAQVLEIAFERGWRDFRFIEQLLERQQTARADQLFDFENTFCFVHAGSVRPGLVFGMRHYSRR